MANRFNNLRVPITSNHRESGSTPYYGANGIQDYVKGYTHDGEFLLIAEDGANDLKDYPIHYVSGKIWVNNHAHVLQAIENYMNNYFLMYALKKLNIQPYLVGGGRSKLNSDVMMRLKLYLPNREEQNKLSALLKNIDETITLLQRKINNLNKVKKGLLQKLFPTKQSINPRIRFNGFNQDWEQRELGEVFKIIDGDRGKNYPNENDFYSSGHTLFLDTGNVQKNGFNFNNLKFINKEKDEMLKNGKLQVYDFILTSRGTLGNVAYYSPKIQAKYSSIRINSAMLILRPISRNSISDSLMTAILGGKIIEDFMSKNHVGSAQPHITKRDFSKLNVYLPSKYEEQEQLGMFILEVDKTITLLQKELEMNKQIKKGFLQKLFPKE
ncbi:Type I restriction modification DNA specificity domain protein [Macrococcoides caseolyticum]|nr:Type I restriction modification DNA specificity domain protein [Macrococcus caseolyticus]